MQEKRPNNPAPPEIRIDLKVRFMLCGFLFHFVDNQGILADKVLFRADDHVEVGIEILAHGEDVEAGFPG